MFFFEPVFQQEYRLHADINKDCNRHPLIEAEPERYGCARDYRWRCRFRRCRHNLFLHAWPLRKKPAVAGQVDAALQAVRIFFVLSAEPK